MPQTEDFGYRPQLQFDSVTKAVTYYLRLYQLLSTPRSIPLKKGATHVSRGDSHSRWENIRQEFAFLTTCFPKSNTTPWYLIVASARTDMQPHQRKKLIEEVTNKRWSMSMYDNATARIYHEIRKKLEQKNLISQRAPFIELHN